MIKINNLKIKNKLIAIILLVTAFTLVIASASIIVIERRTRTNRINAVNMASFTGRKGFTLQTVPYFHPLLRKIPALP